ncbi:hydroxyacid dehydrogenase [Clostridium tetani]|nr:hydroxyacid dehydrogenase [Clostridium tetani]RXI52538.1 hydroxyacid dehydrogenase [Clostridium tetani]RXI56776.1 hydroxyacid dehydrogenase [Clostridium tetani]RXI74557.1 hydroxyacid dehydrogenase [Clostridium tetani]RXM69180.1 hydroxyacid dehydrogenase [Clostridium tetani]
MKYYNTTYIIILGEINYNVCYKWNIYPLGYITALYKEGIFMKIVVLEPLGVSEEKIKNIALKLMDKDHELILHNEKSEDIEVLKKRVETADVLILANMPLKKEVIEAATNLKMISVAFTGIDHINMETCRKNNIMVCNSAGYSTSSVVELTFGLILSLLRNIVPLNDEVRNGNTKQGYSQYDLAGKTLGVIGAGDIGTEVIRIGKAFGCNVLVYNRSEKQHIKELGATQTTLDEVLKNSDIVTLHIPSNNETRGLINSEKLAMMKKDALLINTARGPVVDNKALAEALNKGELGGAGIDVFDMEPPVPEEYELLKTNNSVLTPHIGFATKEAMERRAEIVFRNIEKWIEGNPENIVE